MIWLNSDTNTVSNQEPDDPLSQEQFHTFGLGVLPIAEVQELALMLLYQTLSQDQQGSSCILGFSGTS